MEDQQGCANYIESLHISYANDFEISQKNYLLTNITSPHKVFENIFKRLVGKTYNASAISGCIVSRHRELGAAVYL